MLEFFCFPLGWSYIDLSLEVMVSNTLSVKVSQSAFDRAASWEFRAETGQLGGLL